MLHLSSKTKMAAFLKVTLVHLFIQPLRWVQYFCFVWFGAEMVLGREASGCERNIKRVKRGRGRAALSTSTVIPPKKQGALWQQSTMRACSLNNNNIVLAVFMLKMGGNRGVKSIVRPQ